MAAIKISNLVSTSVVSNTDLLVVVRGTANAYSTNNITIQYFANNLVSILPKANTSSAGTIKIGNNISVNATGFASVTVTGPYANDAVANTNGVAIGNLYYDSTGAVKIRLV